MKKLLQKMAYIAQAIGPFASLTGFILAPARAACSEPGSPMFWFCVVLSVNAVLTTVIWAFSFRKVDYTYSVYAAFVYHTVFEENQLKFRPNLLSAGLGILVGLISLITDSSQVDSALFFVFAVPSGMVCLLLLLILGVCYLYMRLVTARQQDTYISYRAWQVDPKTDQLVSVVEVCQLSELSKNLEASQLLYVAVQERAENQRLIEAAIRAYVKTVQASSDQKGE